MATLNDRKKVTRKHSWGVDRVYGQPLGIEMNGSGGVQLKLAGEKRVYTLILTTDESRALANALLNRWGLKS